jgi:hypothetical protein
MPGIGKLYLNKAQVHFCHDTAQDVAAHFGIRPVTDGVNADQSVMFGLAE